LFLFYVFGHVHPQGSQHFAVKCPTMLYFACSDTLAVHILHPFITRCAINDETCKRMRKVCIYVYVSFLCVESERDEGREGVRKKKRTPHCTTEISCESTTQSLMDSEPRENSAHASRFALPHTSDRETARQTERQRPDRQRQTQRDGHRETERQAGESARARETWITIRMQLSLSLFLVCHFHLGTC
jgi:hypothetical protein